jgi:hypothetical protein
MRQPSSILNRVASTVGTVQVKLQFECKVCSVSVNSVVSSILSLLRTCLLGIDITNDPSSKRIWYACCEMAKLMLICFKTMRPVKVALLDGNGVSSSWSGRDHHRFPAILLVLLPDYPDSPPSRREGLFHMQ